MSLDAAVPGEPLDDVTSRFHHAMQTVDSVIGTVQDSTGLLDNAIGFFGDGTPEDDQTRPFHNEGSHLMQRWTAAVAALSSATSTDDDARAGLATEAEQLASNASSTLIGAGGKPAITYTAAVKDQASDDVGAVEDAAKSAGKAIADDVAKVGTAVTSGVTVALTIGLVVVIGFLWWES